MSWYGSTAFCNYYGYRLPAEWEWQAVADYDGTYTYGCGTTITNSMANYWGSTHPDGTTIIGSFGDPSGYGYGMCDMAGNVWEWTGTYRICRGGCWYDLAYFCRVAYRGVINPGDRYSGIGFRVVLDFP